jgi:geranylgeranyl reductase family protein
LNGACDVIVIGGGPAGAMTAYHLAKAGVRVTVLEAKAFPRQKPCGGGLQWRAVSSIPFDLTPVLRGTIHGVSLSYGLGAPHQRSYSKPLAHTILRPEFDQFLLRQAEAAGALVLHGVRCRGFHTNNNTSISVQTSAGEFAARCLVGADGANSIVRPLLSARDGYFWQAALFCEVPQDLLRADAAAMDDILVDWGTLPSGYAWAFPKRGFINFGAGGPVDVARHLKPYALRFIRSTGLMHPDDLGRLQFVGHQLPTLTAQTPIASKSVVLVGDAAGLVEPFTGDGISFACHSAATAAKCICEALSSGLPDLRSYAAAIHSELLEELSWSRKLLSLSVAFPGYVYRLFKENDAVWQIFCKVLRGEESFGKLKREILGPFAFASRLIDAFTLRREKKAIGAVMQDYKIPTC